MGGGDLADLLDGGGRLMLPPPTHLSYVTRDIDKTIAQMERYLGLPPFRRMKPDYFNQVCFGTPADYEVELGFSMMGCMMFEVIQVLSGTTIYSRFLEERGEGLHHVGYEVDDLAEWMEVYRRLGVDSIMSAERIGLKYAYFDTPGLIVEIVQRSSDDVAQNGPGKRQQLPR